MGFFDSLFGKNATPEQEAYKPNPKADVYFKNLEKINIEWSVLSNLKLFSGDQADAFEEHCRINIEQYKDYAAIEESNGFEPPHHVPAYVRLAMLYEKQKRYLDGIDLCAEAIRVGAYGDNTSGKMYGRLARLIKKSGIDVTDDIKQLAMQQ